MSDTTVPQSDPEMKGFLLKWTNYLKGKTRNQTTMRMSIL